MRGESWQPPADTSVLEQRILGLYNAAGSADTRDSGRLAKAIRELVCDIEREVLPKTPERVLQLVERLLTPNPELLCAVDDCNAALAGAFQAACRLWLHAALDVKQGRSRDAADWAFRLYTLYITDESDVREHLIHFAHLLLNRNELRALVHHFERDMKTAVANGADETAMFALAKPVAGVAALAAPLREPQLYERAVLMLCAEPTDLQTRDIAQCYLECGDALGALRWLRRPWCVSLEGTRRILMDKAYAQLGDPYRKHGISGSG